MQWLFIAVVLLLLQTTYAADTCTQQFAIQENQTRYFTIDVPTGDVDVTRGGFSSGNKDDESVFLVYAHKGAALYSKGPVIIGDSSSTIPSESPGAAIVGGVKHEIDQGTGSMILGGSNNTIDTSDNSTILGSASSYIKTKDGTFIGGGFQHSSSGSTRTATMGGSLHTFAADDSVLVGGTNTSLFGQTSAALGGSNNELGADGTDGVSGFMGGGGGLVNLQQNGALVGGLGNQIGIDGPAMNGFVAAGAQLTLKLGTSSSSSSSSSAVGGLNNTVHGDYSFAGAGQGSVVDGIGSAILGGLNLNIAADKSFIGGGENIDVTATLSAAAGGTHNTVGHPNSIIGGGENNVLDGSQGLGTYSAILGGTNHFISLPNIFIGGGDGSVISGGNGYNSASLGGLRMTIAGDTSFFAACVDCSVDGIGSVSISMVGSSGTHTPGAIYAFMGGVTLGSFAAYGTDIAVLGTEQGQAIGNEAFVGGGQNVVSGGINSAISGGSSNTIGLNTVESFIGGGSNNIWSGNDVAVLGGTFSVLGNDSVDPSGNLWLNGNGSATVAGNFHFVTASWSVIIAGDSNKVLGVQTVDSIGNPSTAVNLVLIAGQLNLIDVDAVSATLLGGYINTLHATNGFIAGGMNLTVNGMNAAAAGGWNNDILGEECGMLSGQHSAVAAGALQAVIIAGEYSTMNGNGFSAGADFSNVEVGSDASAIAAGARNQISDSMAFIGGGDSNQVAGSGAAALAGESNLASVPYTIAIGGKGNVASTAGSLAAGYYATATQFANTFVWADASSTTPFIPALANMFYARAYGGVNFATGTSGLGAYIPSGGSSFMPLSDRTKKTNIVEVEYQSSLAKFTSDVPIFTYNYKSDDRQIAHMGPMAQDMHAAFGLGGKNTTINTIDADGIAMAGLRGLYSDSHKMDERASQLALKARAQKALIAELTEALRAQNTSNEVLAAKASVHTSANAQLARKVHAQQGTIVRLEALIESMSMKLSM